MSSRPERPVFNLTPDPKLVQKAKENAKKFGIPISTVVKEIAEARERAYPFKQDVVDELNRQMPERRNGWQDLRNERRDKKVKHRIEKQKETGEPSSESAADRRGTEPVDLESLTIKEPEPTLFIPESTNAEASTKAYAAPKWYMNIKHTGFGMKQWSKKNDPSERQAVTALLSMKDCIERCEKGRGAQLAKFLDELRDQVHKAEVTLKVNKFVLRKAGILGDTGLVRILKGANFPWDLREDARQLYTRWCAQIFELDLLRGIIQGKDKDRNADSIDAAWRAKYSPSCKYYGEGDLVLGQWWPTQLCTVRDGAHGSAQGGSFISSRLWALSGTC